MTKEEAIKRFQQMKKILSIPNSDAVRTIEAIDMAIEALKTESSTEGKYEKAIKTLQEMPRYLNNVRVKQIKKISIDAIQGKWIIRENGNRECSLCGHERQDGWDYFCGYCGARMKGGDIE